MESDLLQAASEGNVAILQDLIEKRGMSVNIQGQMNRTPLHLAALSGKLEAVMYLLEKGASINAQASSGEAPLHLAVLNGHVTVVEYLLGEGADWKIKNNLGKVPVDYARKKQMKKFFEDAEAGVFNRDDEEVKEVKLKKGLAVDQTVIEELVSGGYARAEILDTIYELAEKGSNTKSMVLIMQELERKKQAKKLQLENQLEPTEKKEEKEDDLCKVCFEAVIDAVLIPCGHAGLCHPCSQNFPTCPICRQQVSQVVKMFRA